MAWVKECISEKISQVITICDIREDTSKNFGKKKTGFLAKQWAQILGVKLPTLDPNAMDTHADRSHSYFKNKGSRGRTSSTKEDPEHSTKKGAASPVTNKAT